MKKTRYSIQVGREGVVLTIDERFWDNTVVLPNGTTQLDINVATVVQEVRAALYLVGTEGPRH